MNVLLSNQEGEGRQEWALFSISEGTNDLIFFSLDEVEKKEESKGLLAL